MIVKPDTTERINISWVYWDIMRFLLIAYIPVFLCDLTIRLLKWLGNWLGLIINIIC